MGSTSTGLVVLRGNSGSGKSTVARRLQDRQVRRLAVVSQDVLRRDVLRVPDQPANPAVELIDLVARFAPRPRHARRRRGHPARRRLRVDVGLARGRPRGNHAVLPIRPAVRRNATTARGARLPGLRGARASAVVARRRRALRLRRREDRGGARPRRGGRPRHDGDALVTPYVALAHACLATRWKLPPRTA
ncbi:AAA family ATPase [Mycobacterium hodleri]|nr:AAA family ATPase [Mycolicibacterium hodleri]